MALDSIGRAERSELTVSRWARNLVEPTVHRGRVLDRAGEYVEGIRDRASLWAGRRLPSDHPSVVETNQLARNVRQALNLPEQAVRAIEPKWVPFAGIRRPTDFSLCVEIDLDRDWTLELRVPDVHRGRGRDKDRLLYAEIFDGLFEVHRLGMQFPGERAHVLSFDFSLPGLAGGTRESAWAENNWIPGSATVVVSGDFVLKSRNADRVAAAKAARVEGLYAPDNGMSVRSAVDRAWWAGIDTWMRTQRPQLRAALESRVAETFGVEVSLNTVFPYGDEKPTKQQKEWLASIAERVSRHATTSKAALFGELFAEWRLSRQPRPDAAAFGAALSELFDWSRAGTYQPTNPDRSGNPRDWIPREKHPNSR